MKQDPIFTPYSPALPTVEQVQKNPELLFSDHLPVIFKALGLTISSWNILNPNLFSGFAPYLEDQEAEEHRFTRIGFAINQIISKNKGLDIILLQEANWGAEEKWQSLLTEENIKDGWEMAASNNPKSEYKLLYKKSDKLSLIECDSKVCIEKLQNVFGDLQKARFQIREGENIKEVTIFNVHPGHNDFPELPENAITTLLYAKESVIVAGDFNIRIAPISYEAKNIVTVMTNCGFRDEVNAGCDWTDGAFFRGPDNFIHQANTTILNPSTGEPLAAEPIKLELWESEFQRKELLCPRHVVRLDHSFSEPKIESVQALQLFLRTKFKEEKILVRMSTNAFNKKYFCLPVKLAQEVSAKLNLPEDEKKLLPHLSMKYFIQVQEFFFRHFNAEANAKFFKPGIDEQICPDHYSFHLPSILHQQILKLDKLKDNGESVEACRAIKKILKSYTEVLDPIAAAFSKIILANYYLSFSEYSVVEFTQMIKDEKHVPDCIIRPTHFSLAIELYVDVMKTVKEIECNLNIEWVLGYGLDQLGRNIIAIHQATCDNFAQLIRFYDKAMGIKITEQSGALHHQQASDILERYKAFSDAYKAFGDLKVGSEYARISPPIKPIDIKALNHSGCVIA